MKVQDILFIGTMLAIFFIRKPYLFLVLGLGCIATSIPLFATWTFFTAERLTWYSAAFFSLFILLSTSKQRGVQ